MNNILGKKTAFLTLGCKVNAYETEAMIELMKEAGAEIVDFSERADIYIINTCTVTNIADRKSRQMLHKAKKGNDAAIVVAVGCYAQEAGESLKEDAAVDIVVGNNRKKEIVEIIDEYIRTDGSVNMLLPEMKLEKEYEMLNIDSFEEKTRAYIKIQDGCNRFCSYCIIPYVRGRIRSRKPGDILDETKTLAAAGYKEIVLTGIHISSYGDDFEKSDENKAHLLLLIKELCKVEGIERIRIGSLEPRIITEDFVKNLAKEEKVCPHFHLSLQSGSDTVLKRMNRKYTTDEYYNGCEIIRKYFDEPAITTDVIVGFPGETEEEFNETYEFLKKIDFAGMHIFKYSRRKGTKADAMPDQIHEEIKHKRSEKLLELEESMRMAYYERTVGKETVLLTEEQIVVDGEVYMTGHDKRYNKYYVITDKNNQNSLIKVRILPKKTEGILLCEISN